MDSAPSKQASANTTPPSTTTMLTRRQPDHSDQEKRLLHLYGKLPRKTDLLHHQLESRQYFDSGDFALSQAATSSDIGAVRTGKEHPTSKSVSHPAAPVPNASNVGKGANDQHRDERKMSLAPGSQLQRESCGDGKGRSVG